MCIYVLFSFNQQDLWWYIKCRLMSCTFSHCHSHADTFQTLQNSNQCTEIGSKDMNQFVKICFMFINIFIVLNLNLITTSLDLFFQKLINDYKECV